MSPYTLAVNQHKQADMIFTNAKIYGHNNANVIAVRDGNIMFVGKTADFAILEQDITRLSHDAIAETQILMTVLQANIVFDVIFYIFSG